jgi:hypothetical protein
MAWKYNDTYIRAGRSWQDENGITHPRNWMIWSDEDKAAAGLVWENDPEPFDNRFYAGRNADGSLIEKNLDDINEVDEDGNALMFDGEQVVTKGLKSNAIALVKDQANNKLSETDWMVVKAAEVADYSVPSEILTYRAAVRTASNDIETAITDAPGFNAYVALYDTPVDADGEPTGNAPINDWPEEI